MTEVPSLLFVDDDPKAGELMARFSEDEPFHCHVFSNPADALDHFKDHSADLVITDLRMPGMSGIELLQAIRSKDNDVPVIIITAYSTVDNAIEALRLGATDFLKKPYDMDELLILIQHTLENSKLRQENRLLKRQLKDERNRFGMIGRAPAIKKVYSTIEKLAEVRCNVIIEGESGTGKELAARAIHDLGKNPQSPFIVIDCGALTDTLLESELFGHERGAFTGAQQSKKGLLELASGGTVFLDEICNISDAMQTKLLRVVQEQQIFHVGGVKPIDIDVRFIVATNRNLEQMVQQGKFRHDLYHRLNVVNIEMPPLRQRSEDIPHLLQYFIEEFARRYHRSVQGFSSESMKKLKAYSWPGNIRELRNLVERHIALADGPQLELEPILQNTDTGTTTDAIDGDQPRLDELEKRYILKVLDHNDGNRELTAATLGINKSTLWRKLQQFQRDDS